jgi:hypothetical protein
MRTGCAVFLAALVGAWFPATSGAQVLDEGLIFHPVAPCRVFDTRPGQGGPGPLAPGVPFPFHIVGSTSNFGAQGGNTGGCSVPGYLGSTPRVKAAMLNFVAVNPQGAGNLRAWPADQAVPNASIINYTTATNIANGVIVPVSQDAQEGQDIMLRADGAGTNVLADVLGYFVLPDLGSANRGSFAPNPDPGQIYMFGSGADPDITPATNQTCMVTVNVGLSRLANIRAQATVHTALWNITDNIRRADDLGDNYLTTDLPRASASATHVWTLEANKAYRLGCAPNLLERWPLATFFCNVSWSCR